MSGGGVSAGEGEKGAGEKKVDQQLPTQAKDAYLLFQVWQQVLQSTVELLYCGHLGDPPKCTVYSGTSLLWTPWGPGEVSCIEWNPSIADTLRTWQSVLYREVSLFQGCPLRGVPLYCCIVYQADWST